MLPNLLIATLNGELRRIIPLETTTKGLRDEFIKKLKIKLGFRLI